MTEVMKATITSYISHLIRLLLAGIKRNILRIHGVGGGHRMRDGAIRPSFEQDNRFRRKYNGKHFLNIWESSWNR